MASKKVIQQLGRVGVALSAFGALTWLLWPSDVWKLEPEPLFVLLGALTSWGIAEWNLVFSTLDSDDQSDTSSHPHDLILYRRYKSLIDTNALVFLRDHDMGGSFSAEELVPFERLARDWRGADFEFHDEVLQQNFSEIITKVRQLVRTIAESANETQPGSNWLSLVPPRERGGFWSDEVSEKVERINNLATEAMSAIDDFERTCRTRIPDAYQD